ncbi:MAG: flagellar basal-body rod protein FlgG [Candidatus Melainabacteria bacterium]|nr:flagellar basal-body rod protein FlgG [Candidatus Melainabacteria bacterium]
MDRSLQTAATGMQAQQTNIDVISHNLANINTTSFKKSMAHFSTLFSQVIKAPGATLNNGQITPNGVQVGLGVQLDSTNKNFTIGSLNNTGNDLDIAIEGDGFFQVQMPNGNLAYTRDGNFQIDGQSGELVTNKGYSVFPNINLGNNIQSVNISEDGNVQVTRAGQFNQVDNVGSIRLARFVNPAGLIEMSDNLYQQTLASGRPIEGTPLEDNLGGLRQGFLEGSNVKVVEEIVNMIAAQRAYEASSNVIRASDEMLQQANNISS